MKIYQVSFDASLFTVVLNDDQELIDVLKERDNSFHKEGDEIFYYWNMEDERLKDECMVTDITDKRGIIHETRN